MNCLRARCFYDIKEVKEAIEKVMLFYNTALPHMSINMMTLQEAAAHTGKIKERMDQL